MTELSELVEAAQAGDSKANAALMQRFQRMAYATAFRYLKDHHLAQDLVQEAALEAFLHLPQLKEPAAFPGWFRQIVFHQCMRVLRQTPLQHTSLEALSDALFAESNPEDLAMQKEVQAYVDSAVASLPPHERLVTMLFYGCHYSYNEVSAYLKIPLTTVKKRLHSARRKLKAQLQATLHDTIENAGRTSDEVEDAEIALAKWGNLNERRTRYNPRIASSGRATGRPRLAQSHGSCKCLSPRWPGRYRRCTLGPFASKCSRATGMCRLYGSSRYRRLFSPAPAVGAA
jgi:RNA polymerase sigma factor (sigma-70 family)